MPRASAACRAPWLSYWTHAARRYELTSAIGQPDVGAVMTAGGGRYQPTGGVWQAAEVPTPDPAGDVDVDVERTDLRMSPVEFGSSLS